MPSTSMSINQNIKSKKFYLISNRRAAILFGTLAPILTAAYLLFSHLVSFTLIGSLYFSLTLLASSLAGGFLGYHLNNFLFNFRNLIAPIKANEIQPAGQQDQISKKNEEQPTAHQAQSSKKNNEQPTAQQTQSSKESEEQPTAHQTQSSKKNEEQPTTQQAQSSKENNEQPTAQQAKIFIKYPLIQIYVNEKHLSFQEALNLQFYKMESLNSKTLRQLFLDNKLTFSQLLKLDWRDRQVLEQNEEILQRFRNGTLDLAFISHPYAQTYINEGHVTSEEAQQLFDGAKQNLNNPLLHNLFLDDFLDLQQLKKIDYEQVRVLKNNNEILQRFKEGKLDLAFVTHPLVQTYVNEGHLTLKQAKELRPYNMNILNSPTLRQLFKSNCFNFQQLRELTYKQIKVLESNKDDARQRLISGELDIALVSYPLVEEFVNEGFLPLQLAKKLAHSEKLNLSTPHLISLFKGKHLSLQQHIDLTRGQRDALIDKSIKEAFIHGRLDISLVAQPIIQNYVDEGHLTLQQANNLNEHQKSLLDSYMHREIFEANRISFQQLINIPVEQRFTLTWNHEIFEDIISGRLRVHDIIGELNQDNFNNTQSTHTHSVHKSISKSASRLLKRYNPAAFDNLETVIKNIQQWAENLKDDSPENKAVKSCVLRITQIDYCFIDPTSKVSTRQLLAMTWTAIHDKTLRKGTLTDALNLFASGLYEIQRGYNLNRVGIDNNSSSEDRHICSSGTFNKIMEKLVGIHPDVIVIFMSMGSAALKLPIVVEEEAQTYLANLINDKHQNERATLTDLLENIKENGASAIWEKIQTQVSKQMFDEFGNLFKSKNDPEFTAFIAAGADTSLDNLELPYQYSLTDQPINTFSCKPSFKNHMANNAKTAEEKRHQQLHANLAAQAIDNISSPVVKADSHYRH